MGWLVVSDHAAQTQPWPQFTVIRHISVGVLSRAMSKRTWLWPVGCRFSVACQVVCPWRYGEAVHGSKYLYYRLPRIQESFTYERRKAGRMHEPSLSLSVTRLRVCLSMEVRSKVDALPRQVNYSVPLGALLIFP
jgi:hypothetical protein